MHSHEVHWLQKVLNRVILEGRRQITIWQSLPVVNQVLILILGTIMIPFILAISFPILLTLIFAIPGIILGIRWFAMFSADGSDTGVGDMKIPTFYTSGSPLMEDSGDGVAIFFCMPLVGSVFGGIHCVGWFFNFLSSAEAMLWRVSSAVLTGMAFLFPIFALFLGFLSQFINNTSLQKRFFVAAFSIMILVYVVSRLLLLVEAFISLRHFTPRMLALVKWTSFIPHI